LKEAEATLILQYFDWIFVDMEKVNLNNSSAAEVRHRPMSQPNAPASDSLGEPLRVIRDASTVRCAFNVMPDREVEETFFVREYRLWHRYMEAEFDRKYISQMAHSPSHIIFLTALTHGQKMLYVYLCHELGIPYEPEGAERMKLWPSKVNVRMPKLVTAEQGIVHRLNIISVKRYGDTKLKVVFRSKIDNVISIDGEVPVFLV
jgi:hypothetical protein